MVDIITNIADTADMEAEAIIDEALSDSPEATAARVDALTDMATVDWNTSDSTYREQARALITNAA